MTEEQRKEIDYMPLEDMLRRWRYAPAGDPQFQGERGEYFAQVMSAKRARDNGAWVAASKAIGWDR